MTKKRAVYKGREGREGKDDRKRKKAHLFLCALAREQGHEHVAVAVAVLGEGVEDLAQGGRSQGLLVLLEGGLVGVEGWAVRLLLGSEHGR